MIIVSDASPVIALAVCGKLDVLEALFEKVCIPQAVFDELAVPGKLQAAEITAWAKNRIVAAKNTAAVTALSLSLDPGESEALSLYWEMAGDPVSAAPPLAAFAAGNAAFFDNLWDKAIYPHNKPKPEDNKLFIAETLKQRCLLDVDWALANFNMSGASNGYTPGTGTIGKISCPVACTSGVSDYVVPPDTVKTNTDAIPGARLLVYENCGHSPLVDCPDRLAADLLSLMARAG